MSKLDARAGGIKSPEVAQRSPTQTSEERRYAAESNIQTIQRYHDIMKDQKLLGDVQQYAKEQMKRLSDVANHASGATTRGKDSPGSDGTSGKTKTSGPPKAMNKAGGGAPTKKGMAKEKHTATR